MTTQETAKALRCCAEGLTGCLDCPLLGKSKRYCDDMHNNAADQLELLTAELETTRLQLKRAEQERNAWKLRAEAAERDIDHCCSTCQYHYVFFNGCTPDHDCTNPDGGCTNNCDRWHWRGPCAENGGTDATD